jgi:excisionase family DNA binding protein
MGEIKKTSEVTVARARDRLLTVSEVAGILGVSKQWVYDHTDRCEPRLSCVRLGSAVRFRATDIDAFIQQQLNAPRRRRRR